MKTGFLYGNARTPKFKYYSYHGKILQCRKEPWIPPYIYYDTHPAEYPPNYYYECDTMPDGATPPMTYIIYGPVNITLGGGILNFRQVVDPPATHPSITGYWTIHPTSKIEITAEYPTIEIFDPGTGYVDAYVDITGVAIIALQRHYELLHEHNYIAEETTYITKLGFYPESYQRPFTNSIHILFEKVPDTDLWNFYFNDEWIFDLTNPYPDYIRFRMYLGSSEGGYVTMDYIRAWIDTERY